MRTDKQIKEELERRGPISHSRGCGWPKDPCNCEVDNERLRRRSHDNACTYPNDPCSCGLC